MIPHQRRRRRRVLSPTEFSARGGPASAGGAVSTPPAAATSAATGAAGGPELAELVDAVRRWRLSARIGGVCLAVQLGVVVVVARLAGGWLLIAAVVILVVGCVLAVDNRRRWDIAADELRAWYAAHGAEGSP